MHGMGCMHFDDLAEGRNKTGTTSPHVTSRVWWMMQTWKDRGVGRQPSGFFLHRLSKRLTKFMDIQEIK